MQDFNPELPEDLPARVSRWEDISVGFEHTIDDATGDIVFTFGADGRPIPRVYRVNVRPTPREVMAKANEISEAQILALTAAFKTNDGAAQVEAVGSILERVAGPWVRQLLDDPTVDPGVASKVVWWLVEVYGLTEVVMLAAYAASPDEAPEEDEEGDDRPFG